MVSLLSADEPAASTDWELAKNGDHHVDDRSSVAEPLAMDLLEGDPDEVFCSWSILYRIRTGCRVRAAHPQVEGGPASPVPSAEVPLTTSLG